MTVKLQKLILAFILVLTPYIAYSQNKTEAHTWDVHRIAIIDAGSTGSRIYLFTWNSVDASGIPILMPMQDPITKEFGALASPGIGSPVFRDARDAALSLEPLLHFANSVLGSKISETTVFLNATAGLRLLPSEKRNAILNQALAQLGAAGFKLPSDSKRAARIIDGDEEGIDAWIGTNYFLGTLEHPESTIGVLDLGGASSQITYATDRPNGEGIHQVKIGKKTIQLFSHSFLGLGMHEAYKSLAHKECIPLYHTRDADHVVSFDHCVTSNTTHLQSAVHGDSSLLRPIQDAKVLNKEFYLISGYKYIHDYLMKFENEKSQNISWLNFFKKNGDKACHLTSEEISSFHHNITSEEESQKFCFYSAYTVALLQRLGFSEHSHLEFKNSIPFEGHEVPLGWHLGAALLEANNIQIAHDASKKPEKQKEKGYFSAAIDMGFFGTAKAVGGTVVGGVDTVANEANLKAGIGTAKGSVASYTNQQVNMNWDPNSLQPDSWAKTLMSPLTYVKWESAFTIYRGIRDSNKIWDIQALVDTSVGVISLVKFAGTSMGYIASFAIPQAPAFITAMNALTTLHYATVAAGGVNAVYFKLPSVRDKFDEQIFGENLEDMGNMQTVYDWKSFENSEKQNNPYLKCNFYKSKEDLLKSSKPLSAQFVTKDDIKKSC